MFEAVLFDFAGTVMMPVAPREMLSAAVAALGLELGSERVAELAKRYAEAGIAGGPYPDSVPGELAELYAKRDLSAELHRQAHLGLLETVAQPDPRLPEAFYEQLLSPQGWAPYADAAAVVTELAARGVAVGLISNIGFDTRPILRHHGLHQLAEHAVNSYEEGAIKPDPAIFQAALRRLGCEPQQALMVGDNPTADAGAAQLGITTLILPMTPPGTVHGLELVLALVQASR